MVPIVRPLLPLLAALLAARVPAAPSQPPPSLGPGPSGPVPAVAAAAPTPAAPATLPELLAAINEARTAAGVPPLAHAPRLDRVAQARAEEIGSHGALPGEADSATLFGRMQQLLGRSGYVSHAWIESATATAGDAAAVVSYWKQDGSFPEAMRADFRDLGIGFAKLSGVPLYVFFIACPERDFYARQVAPLGDLAAARRAMLSAVNAARAAAGLRGLAADPRMDGAAQAHAEDMLARSYYAHQSPDGTLPGERVRTAGFPAGLVGENIAARHLSVEEAISGWLGSSAHRQNILDPRFTHLGIGLAVGGWEHRYQVLWVQDFGRLEGVAGD